MQTFTFGKHKDRSISDPRVDLNYLLWLRDRCKQDVADLEAEITRREQAAYGDLSWAERIVQIGFRTLSQQHHPDHGGDTVDMQNIIGAKAELARMLEMLRSQQRR